MLMVVDKVNGKKVEVGKAAGFTGEENPFRINKVVHEINFGLLKFDFKNKKVLFEIRGSGNKILETFTQQY